MSTMDSKDIIIFDTNTLIEYGNSLPDTVAKLSTKYDVYITEVSIEERLGQKFIEDKKIYAKADEISQQVSPYIKVEKVIPFTEKFNSDEKDLRCFYSELFGDRIIPFNSDKDMLSEVFVRATRKIPPFTITDNSSDKGFKDSLMWLSILNYFVSNSFNRAIFIISSDKSFCRQNSEFLKDEFKQKTGLNIEFRDNSFCLDNIVVKSDSKNDTVVGSISDDTHIKDRTQVSNISQEELNQLRSTVSKTIHMICVVDIWNQFDECFEKNAFITYTLFETNKVRLMLDGLDAFLFNHLFQENIAPSEIWGDLYGVVDKHNIPYDNIDDINNLYKVIKDKYAGLVVIFLNAICHEINSTNYKEPPLPEIDVDMPF